MHWRDGIVPWIIVAAFVLIGAGAGVGAAMLISERTRRTRGFQNNNPGNLRHGSTWLGLRPTQSDPEFAQFIAPEFGIRAMTLTLQKYLRPVSHGGYGLNTLRAIISRYAPPGENDTEGYIKRAGARMGIPYAAPGTNPPGIHSNAPIDFSQRLSSLVGSMIAEEIGFGEQPYPTDVLTHGIALASDSVRAAGAVANVQRLPSARLT